VEIRVNVEIRQQKSIKKSIKKSKIFLGYSKLIVYKTNPNF